jgi:predicted dehydrogenase
VFTRRIEKSREFTAKFGGTPYDNAEAAFIDPNVDAVYVVTPHNSHYC